jgi:hypothetical protein
MDYGKILSRAWHIVWENKWLMVLGFLAALGSGGSSGGSGNFNARNPRDLGSQLPGNFGETIREIAPFIVVIVCVFFVLGIVLWLLRLMGEAGMIASVDRIEAGEKLTLRDGFNAGKSHLKNMVGLSLVLLAPFLLIGLITAAGAISLVITGGNGGEDFAGRGFGALALCFFPLVCILGMGGLVVAFIYPMAQRSIILEGLGVMDGIRRGWQVLKQNFVEILLLAVIFGVIGFVVGIATLIVALPVALIFLVPTIFAAVQGSAVFTAGTIILGVIGAIVFILLAAAIGSIVRAFQSTAFTLGYHQWTSKAAFGVGKDLA